MPLSYSGAPAGPAAGGEGASSSVSDCGGVAGAGGVAVFVVRQGASMNDVEPVNADGTPVTCEMTGNIRLAVGVGEPWVAVSVDSDGPILMSIENDGDVVAVAPDVLLLPDEAEAIAHALIVAAAKSRQNADKLRG